MTMETRDFNKAAAGWDDNPTRVKLADDVRACIEKRLVPEGSLRVLDFGCGTGLLSLPWSGRIAALSGIDSSPGMLEVFRAKAAQAGAGDVDTRLIDNDTPADLGGPYDAIVSSMTLHHIPDTGALLQRLKASLTCGGRLFLADLDPDDGQFHADNTGVFHFGFERAALKRLLAENGFVDIEDDTAATIERPGADGRQRAFTIFLIAARLPGA